MPKPQFEIIKSHILQKIERGLWGQGDAVPSENQLAESFGVSRMTARRALSDLTGSGVLERVRGSGTFVANQLPTGSLLEIRNIADEISARGHRHHAMVIDLERRRADQRTGALLALAPGAEYFYSRLMHFENDLPIQLEERLVNPALAPAYLEQDFARQTPSAYLTQIAPLSEADHWVEAIIGDTDTCRHLRITECEPCLKISRRTFTRRPNSPHPDVVNFAYLIHPGTRYRLGGHLNF